VTEAQIDIVSPPTDVNEIGVDFANAVFVIPELDGTIVIRWRLLGHARCSPSLRALTDDQGIASAALLYIVRARLISTGRNPRRSKLVGGI
jgi:hypothetical protein